MLSQQLGLELHSPLFCEPASTSHHHLVCRTPRRGLTFQTGPGGEEQSALPTHKDSPSSPAARQHPWAAPWHPSASWSCESRGHLCHASALRRWRGRQSPGTHRLEADATENNPSWEAAAFGLTKTSTTSKEKQLQRAQVS